MQQVSVSNPEKSFGYQSRRSKLAAFVVCILRGFQNRSEMPSEGDKGAFRLAYKADISFSDYVNRIAIFYPCSDATLILAAIYIHQLDRRHPLLVDPRTIHKLFLACVVLAAKLHEDNLPCTMKHFAEIVGAQPYEIVGLEKKLIKFMDYSLFICPVKYSLVISRITESNFHSHCNCLSFLRDLMPSITCYTETT